MANNKILYICLFGLWYLQNIAALKITRLDVPKNAWDAVKLNCKYDLEGGTLYTVKWYKDGKEFFRCLADGTSKKFELEDINIYSYGTYQYGSCFFELTALTPRSGGIYTCEVSLDSPTFQTISEQARLQIIEPSKRFQSETTENTDISLSPIIQNKGSPSLYLSSLVVIFIFYFTIVLVCLGQLDFYV